MTSPMPGARHAPGNRWLVDDTYVKDAPRSAVCYPSRAGKKLAGRFLGLMTDVDLSPGEVDLARGGFARPGQQAAQLVPEP